MDFDIDRFGKNLMLTEDEDDGSIVPLTVWNEHNYKADLIMVRRLLRTKHFNFEDFSNTIRSVWSVKKGVEISRIVGDRILFRFNHEVDKRRVVAGCPWSFDKSLLIMSSVEPDMNPLHVDLNWSSFYVRIYDVPILRQTKEMAEYIGNKIGTFEELDSEKQWGVHMRIKVKIDVTKPLKRALRIRGGDGVNLIVSFTYERFPIFCYLCGKLGHVERDCEARYDSGNSDQPTTMPYGPWLRESFEPPTNFRCK